MTAVCLLLAAFSAVQPADGPEAWLLFMGGNVRRDGLRCDLEAIKSAGFSGVHLFHNDRKGVGVWPGCEKQIACMGPDWNGLMGYLGDECEHLGLTLTLQNCPGWSQSGGPWITLDNCMRELKCARRDVRGGEAAVLPDIPAGLRDHDSDWRDIAVVAFRTPQGDDGSELKPVSEERRGDVRTYRFAKPVTVRSFELPPLRSFDRPHAYNAPWMEAELAAVDGDGRETCVFRSKLPVYCWRDDRYPLTLACDERTAATWRFTVRHEYPISDYGAIRFFSAARQSNWEMKSGLVLRSLMRERPPVQDRRCWIDRAAFIDVSDRQCADGTLDWRAPDGGDWTVLRVGHVNTKAVNAPAPPEATGWECDKLAPEGIEAHFRGYVGQLNDGVLKGRLGGMLVDSWECYCQNWTPRMERYFAEANGYGLRPFLPALFGWVVGNPETTEGFLTDWRRTLGDLITRNYYGRMAELAHDAGLEVFYETAFGDMIAGDILEYWKYADAPMCEFWSPHRTADEGGCGSFAYKSILPCASAAHVYGKRRVVAEAFTEGGISWNETLDALADDANRVFARGVTHLAFGAYTHVPQVDALPPGGSNGGYNGTPFSRLQTWWRHMPAFVGWLTRCERLLESGTPVADVLWYLGDAVDHKPDVNFPFPEGFRYDYLNADALVHRIAVKDGFFTTPEGVRWRILWVPDDYRMRSVTRRRLGELAAAGGTVVFGGKDALVRALAGTSADVKTEPALGDGLSEEFMWLHRREGAVDRYFVAAGTNGFRGQVTFRATGPVSVYDPVADECRAWVNGTELAIPPSRSVFVEFGMEVEKIERVEKVENVERVEIGGWTLKFEKGWGVPDEVKLDKLVSWTEIPGFSPEARAYSGTVVYEADFDWPAAKVSQTVELDLGRVESIAAVEMNGQPVRTLWCAPYTCDVGRFLKPGRNHVRLTVTHTWLNRVLYDLNQPADKRKTWLQYRPKYNPKPTDTPVASGLLGPVRVRES